jgi:hypothetical protein
LPAEPPAPSTRQGGGRRIFFAMPLNCTKNAIFVWEFLLFLSSPRTYPNGKHIAIATTPRYSRFDKPPPQISGIPYLFPSTINTSNKGKRERGKGLYS